MKYFKNLDRLEFSVTYLCSSECRHCFVGNETKQRYKGHIPKELAVNIVDSMADKFKLNSVMTFGGEPMLFPDVTCAIFSTAKKHGIPRRDVISNGYWTKDLGKVKDLAQQLVESGANLIVLSVDCFHAEHVPLKFPETTAQELLNAGVEVLKWQPVWVISKDHDNKYNRKTKEVLKSLSHINIPVSDGNIVDQRGQALDTVGDMLVKKPISELHCGNDDYTERPDDITALTIEPNGNFNLCPNFHGECSKENIIDILKKYNPYKDEISKIILEKDLQGLAAYAEKNKLKLNAEGYYSACDMCNKISTQL